MFLLSIGLMLPGIVLAQIPPAPPVYQPMKIHQTAEPIYPYHAQQLGISSGEACIAIATDSTGQIVDHLVIGYTHPDFAEAALVAIKRWRFEPALLQGDPVGNLVEVTVHFETQGTIVTSQTILEHLEARLVSMMQAGYAFHPCPPQKLDGMPTPVTTVAPAYTKELAGKGIKGSIPVEFYIDEKGAVRLPAVSAKCDAVLGSLAVTAMSQWKFTPPTSKGHAVMVKAVQVFHFANGG
jgi:TonB family protein